MPAHAPREVSFTTSQSSNNETRMRDISKERQLKVLKRKNTQPLTNSVEYEYKKALKEMGKKKLESKHISNLNIARNKTQISSSQDKTLTYRQQISGLEITTTDEKENWQIPKKTTKIKTSTQNDDGVEQNNKFEHFNNADVMDFSQEISTPTNDNEQTQNIPNQVD